MLSFLLGLVFFCLGLFGPFFFEPVVGLAVFAALTHITPQQLHVESLRIPLSTACATLISYLFSSLYLKKFNVFPPELILFSIMLMGMFLGAVNAYDSQLAFEYFFIYCKYGLFLLMMVNIIDSLPRIELFHNFLILSAAWLVYKCWDLRGTTGGRFENIDGGVVGDSNHFAAALILLMPLVLMRVFRKTNSIIRVGAILGYFGMIMSVAITVSRGGFLGLAASLFCFFIFLKKHRIRIIILLFLLGITVLPFLPPSYLDRISTISETDGRDASSQNRLNSWGVAIDVWKKHPIYGCGLRNFIYYNAYLNEGKQWGQKGHVAHSIWFEALSEGGLLVFLPFVGMIFLFFYRTARAKRKFFSETEIYADIVALEIGMIGFLVCASFVNRLIYEPIYWWCCLAYIYDQRIKININVKYDKQC